MPKMAQDRPKTIQAWPNTAQYGTKREPRRSERTPGEAQAARSCLKMASRWPPDNPRWPQDGVSVLGVVSRRPPDGHQITRESPQMASQLARTRGRPPERPFRKGSGTRFCRKNLTILQKFVFQEALSQDKPKTMQAWPKTPQFGTEREPRRSERTPGETQAARNCLKMASRWPPDKPRWPQDGVAVLDFVSRRPPDGHRITPK